MAGKTNQVIGIYELVAKLRSLGTHEAVAKISHKATFGAAKDVREDARKNAMPLYWTGALDRGLAIKRLVEGTKRGYTIGVRHGRKRKVTRAPKGFMGPMQQDDPFYWWWLEFGTVHIPPKGFLRKAFVQAQSKTLPEIQAAAIKAVYAATNAALKKMGNGPGKPK